MSHQFLPWPCLYFGRQSAPRRRYLFFTASSVCSFCALIEQSPVKRAETAMDFMRGTLSLAQENTSRSISKGLTGWKAFKVHTKCHSRQANNTPCVQPGLVRTPLKHSKAIESLLPLPSLMFESSDPNHVSLPEKSSLW